MSGRPRRAFGIVSKVVMRDASIPLGSKALYALLCAYADDDGCCFPSNETLAADLGVSESSVVRGLRTLAERGLVVREPRYVDNRQTTSVTRITDLDVSDLTPRPVTGDTPEGGMGDTPGGVTGDYQNNTTSNGTTTNTSTGDDPEPATDASPAGDEAEKQEPSVLFAEWWEHWPVKVSKGAAEKAFTAALKKVDYPVLKSGLIAAIVDWRATEKLVKKDGKWVPTDRSHFPHASTWLNAERWADEHPTLGVQVGIDTENGDTSWMRRTPENTI